MNLEDFRAEGKKMIDYICEYRRTLPEQRVIPGPEIKANELKKVMSGEFESKNWNSISKRLKLRNKFCIFFFDQIKYRLMAKILKKLCKILKNMLFQGLYTGVIRISLLIFQRQVHIQEFWVIC